MYRKILASVFAAAVLVAMAVPLFGGAGTALAGKLIVFDMNDRFATERYAHSVGLGKVRATQEGSIEIELVRAINLLPNHSYELQVTIQLADPGDFTGTVDIVISDSITTDKNGHLEIKDFNLGSFGQGDYRLDLFVTHTVSTVSGSAGVGEFLTGLLDRDPLLACEPAPVVTVE
jgi:hypothetical protein